MQAERARRQPALDWSSVAQTVAAVTQAHAVSCASTRRRPVGSRLACRIGGATRSRADPQPGRATTGRWSQSHSDRARFLLRVVPPDPSARLPDVPRLGAHAARRLALARATTSRPAPSAEGARTALAKLVCRRDLLLAVDPATDTPPGRARAAARAGRTREELASSTSYVPADEVRQRLGLDGGVEPSGHLRGERPSDRVPRS